MRRRVSIYKSYSPERRQETAGVQNNRSWVRASPVLSLFPTSMCEKDKALARRKPTTYGFERQRLTNTPLRPVVFYLLSAII